MDRPIGFDEAATEQSLNKRQQAILRWVESEGLVRVDDMVRRYDVTEQTIRRDLTKLESLQHLRRVHGGAKPVNSTQNIAYRDRQILNLSEKQRIATAIAAHIPDHASIFINIGTTTETIAHALMQHRGLQVVTNNLHVASLMSQKPDFRVIVTSGEVRSSDGGIVGEATLDFIEQFKLDYGLIGISAIDAEGALLDFDYREVKVAQAIIEHSRQVYLAADHSKFGRKAMVRLGNIAQADMFFTDRPPDADILRVMNESDVQLQICR
ncbi:DeoR/GlpR family DNA-binding transcription regulator [Reinekea blandensis]|uniref:Transcriptional regulator of sugar metabolism n=1 Tax=Reinekea blandensis MED297 TaxID=314283 RepID=A4BGS9_9GAMM|nr:DeoR family transcriptional regulator [Reinekea blandensis]EAR08727.1 Transcriptional regulator of sugar metabolism [Reinekea sp. MED297] [Reinekea blandensis MED297]